jgi:hypothetical protein
MLPDVIQRMLQYLYFFNKNNNNNNKNKKKNRKILDRHVTLSTITDWLPVSVRESVSV